MLGMLFLSALCKSIYSSLSISRQLHHLPDQPKEYHARSPRASTPPFSDAQSALLAQQQLIVQQMQQQQQSLGPWEVRDPGFENGQMVIE